MRKILQKADEMEMFINLKAARNAYAFLLTAAMVYSLITAITTGELPFMFLFATVSGVIFWFTKLIETNRLTKQADDDEE